MKKLILGPLALAAITASMGALAQTSSVTLYGQMAAAIEYRDHQGPGAGGNQWQLGNNEFYVSHIGLRGVEDLGGGMKAIFRLESGINTDVGTAGGPSVSGAAATTKFWNRQSFVGLDMGSNGTVTLGRQFSAGVDRAVRTIDPYNAGGNGLSTTPIALYGINRYSTNGTTYIANDNRTDDSVKYRLTVPTMGLDMGASFGFDDGEGRSYSVDIGQTTKTYNIGATIIRYQSPTNLSNGHTPTATTWMAGGSMLFGSLRIYASYLNSEMDQAAVSATTPLGSPAQKNKVTILGARYSLAPNIDLTGTWYGDKGTSMNNVLNRDGKKNTYIASVEYFLSKRTLINVAYFRNTFTDGWRFDPTHATSLSGGSLHATGITGLPFPAAGAAAFAGFESFSGFQVGIRHAF